MSSSYRQILNFIISLVLGLSTFTLIGMYTAPSMLTEIPYRTSWLGNTFSGGDKWVQMQISALFVAPNGTIYTNSTWDESGREVGIYSSNGEVIGRAKDLHGWGRLGGTAITANSKYIYVAMKQEPVGNINQDYPPSGTSWYCVRRYKLSGEPAPFINGKGWDKSMLIVNTSIPVTGLATSGNELYVSDRSTNRILVYDTEKMTELRSWQFERPGQITVDRQNNLWIIQSKDNNNPAKILQYSKAGNLLYKQIRDVEEPTAIAIDKQNRLLVTDNSSRQQVLIYDITKTPKIIKTLGIRGGIYADKPGEVKELKFAGLTGIGTDSAGNIYVSNDGFNRSGADLRKFSPDQKLQWQLLGLAFLDNADVDPSSDGVDVFTKDEHFVMDYSKSSGKEWRYQEYTLDKFRYPDDPRLHTIPTAPFVRRIDGKRFLFLTPQMSETLSIYRFDGAIAVPCAIFSREHRDWPGNQPQTGSWIWRDTNGDGAIQSNEYERIGEAESDLWGWEVDSKGDIWQVSESGFIRHYRYQGLDNYGSPIYTKAASEKIPMPAPFNKLERIKYFPEQDVMYLGGYTSDRPHQGKEWGIVGTEIIRYDNWTKTKDIRWRISLPYDPAANPMQIVKAMDVAGNKVFAVTSMQAEVYVYDASNGAFLNKLKPGKEIANESGWIDIPYGLRAYQRSNGEYLVFLEEVTKAKVIFYRFGAKQY